ncbi:MAG TPA: proprotein convertase P-domain-containing protein [Dokdonella sp.]|uniref:proprotein convertase P-domain-containing protein n=1 Tax=Dokdonella sp. TaxID=2291710 RepID=UPI002B6975E7|nr:proprotein convertase P-domain-containing protein [Dokdonella sp.]HUD42613.1 proprotein convertase P-domain-containing protein [Dokdonella sp.]
MSKLSRLGHPPGAALVAACVTAAIASATVHAQQLDEAPWRPGAKAQLTADAAAPRAIWQPPANAIYDNGPLTSGTAPGCSGDAGNASILQDAALAMSTFGAGHAVSSGFRVADDFVVPGGQTWNVTGANFFAYQTGSGATSTINAVNVRIWNGVPGTGTVVCGDTTTNRMDATAASGVFRTLESGPDCTRPVMVQHVDLSACPPLGSGTYWIDWQTGGSLASGPWAPPIVIAGQATTGNAMQFEPTAATWGPLLDTGSGTTQGLPFVLEGPSGPALAFDTAAAMLTDSCAANPAQDNGVVEPGETVDIAVPVHATGGNFTNVVASLALPAPGSVVYVVSSANLGTLNAGQSATAHFQIRVEKSFTCLSDFTLPLAVTSNEGSATGSIDVTVGAPASPAPADVPVAIPDNNPTGISSTIAVTQNLTLTDLQVRVRATHTWVGDLIVQLTSPAGTTVTLLDRPGVPATTNGCNNNDLDLTFADGQSDPEAVCDTAGTGAAWPVTDAGPTQPLSAFDGQSTLGNWVLTISDHANIDTGTLVDWELIPTPAFEGGCEVCGGLADLIFEDGFEP